MRFSVYQESKKGARRVNQDRMGYCFARDAMLMVLCDSLGGHSLGEVATQQALQTMVRRFQHHTHSSIRNPRDFLHESIILAHHDIHRYVGANGLLDTPRTTIVYAFTQRGSLHWAHVGDSRMYLMRKGELVTRTHDHSKIENPLQQDRILSMQIVNHPEHNRIYNCLGSPNLLLIDIGGPVNLEPGDVAMLCSDGLWDSMQEDRLIDTYTSFSVTQAIPELIARALYNAGDSADNTTAISTMWELDAMTTTQGSVRTDTLPLNAFTTSILDTSQSGSGLMSEEETERSIVEIRAAIDKTSSLTR